MKEKCTYYLNPCPLRKCIPWPLRNVLLIYYEEHSLTTKKDIHCPPKNRYCSIINRQYHKGFGGFGSKVLPLEENLWISLREP